MNSALPGLVVDVEARIDKLEKGLAKANIAQRRASDQMEHRAKQSADRLRSTYGKSAEGIAASFRRLAPAFVGGFIGGAATAAIKETITKVNAVAHGIAAIGDQAKRAGVSARVFQEWKFVAEQNRIGIDQMIDGLKEMNLRADEFIVTGKGPAAEAFARLGYGAEELKTKLEDPSELLVEIMGRMRRLDTAARIRVGDELFGGSAGERFVELVNQGENGLRRTIGWAHELGVVLSDDVVRKADEVSRKFDAMTARISAFGKRVVVEIAEGIAEIGDFRAKLDEIFDSEAQGRAVLGDEIYDALDANRDSLEENKREVRDLRETYAELFREVNRMTGPDGIRVFEIDDEEAKLALADIMSAMREAADEFEAGQISAEDFGERMADLVADAKDVRDELAGIDGVGFASVITNINGIADALSRAIGEAQKLKASLPGGYVSSGRGDGAAEVARRTEDGNGPPSDLAPTSSRRPRAAPPLTDERGGSGGGGGGGSARADDFEETAKSIRDEIGLLQLEAAALTATAAAGNEYADAIEFARKEAELLHAAQLAGKQITPELRAEIRALAAEYDAAAQAAEMAEDTHDRLRDAKDQVRSSLGDTFRDLVTGAQDFDSALASVLGKLAEMAATRLFDMAWEGGLGDGLFGGLASLLGFASGGYTGSGGKYQPAGIVHRGEYVFSKEAVQRLGVDGLAGLHSAALRGFADGGYVGALPSLKAAVAPSARAGGGDQIVTIHAPVTVNGSAGSPEQNADLAERMAREMDSTMRGVIRDELRRQMRPGNMIGNLRR